MKRFDSIIRPKTDNKAQNYRMLFVIMLSIAILLVYRDIIGGNVNKYFFCLIVFPYVLFADIKNVYILWCYIMPLTVGLPGNLLLPCFLFRLLIQQIHNFKVTHIKEFCYTIFLMCFMLLQNISYGYTSMYNMMCIAELLLVYMIIIKNNKTDIPAMIASYSVGVALTGLIMLFATLKNVSILYLFSSSTRLGDYLYAEGMRINIDPNFYGLFAITVLSANWLLIHAKIYSNTQKTIAYISMLISFAIGLIGLSRGFIVGLVLWSILTFVLEKNTSTKIHVIAFISILLIAALLFFSDAVDAVMTRFGGADTLTGNGRIGLMQRYGEEWQESIYTIIFGIGLFVSETHCMQAQFLFGIGLVGTIPLFILGIRYWKYSLMGEKIHGSAQVPFIIVQIVAAFLPAARTLTYMMPVIVSLLVLQAYNYSLREKTKIEYKENKNENKKTSYIIRNSGNVVICDD